MPRTRKDRHSKGLEIFFGRVYDIQVLVDSRVESPCEEKALQSISLCLVFCQLDFPVTDILYFAPQWSQERLGNLTFCHSVTVVVNNERSQLTAGGPSVVLLLFLQDLPLIETFHCFASIPFPSLSSKGPLSTFIN